MSSHREAPEISKDPVADNTDTYAFVSPDRANTVTIITNYIPLEGAAGGPNFYEFGTDVLYEIHVDNDGDALAEITYRFRFQTELQNPNTFLYNTGPITSLNSPNWNRRQFFSVSKVVNGEETVLSEHLTCPPCNVGVRSTPNYAALAQAAVHTLPTGEVVFAGQRDEGFFVDLGSIFDLGALRPFQTLHLLPLPSAEGVDSTRFLNVHTIAIQVPKTQLTRDGSNPAAVSDPRSVIGVWGSASRRKSRILQDDGEETVLAGPWQQVSRLGNPLVNEVIIPMGKKDRWNSEQPNEDSEFLVYFQHPELAGLLPVLYPGVFPNLAAYKPARADLVAILLTGIPSGIVSGFQNFTGSTPADMLRLNMAIPPAGTPNPLGILGGDLAGFPNGRRVQDDVVTIEVRAVAGLTIPLVDHTFHPDAAAAVVSDFKVTPTRSFLSRFPYLGVANDGFDHTP